MPIAGFTPELVADGVKRTDVELVDLVADARKPDAESYDDGEIGLEADVAALSQRIVVSIDLDQLDRLELFRERSRRLV